MDFFRPREDYHELEDAGGEKQKRVPIEIEKLSQYSDSDRIQRKLREGAILLVNIEKLKKENVGELRQAIERIKRTCESSGGEVVMVGEHWVLVSPALAKIIK